MSKKTTRTALSAHMQDITIGKGIAIILVVMTHIMARQHSLGNEWYDVFTYTIGLVHMPFFVFISGYLHFKLGRIERLTDDWKNYLKGQTIRLILPAFVLGIFVLTGKTIMQQIMHVDNVPDDFFIGLTNLLWNTKYSASFSIWYIWSIFIYTLTSLIIFKVFKNNMFLWCVLGLAIFFIPYIPYMYLGKATMYFLFFCLGGAARMHQDKYLRLLKNNKVEVIVFSLFALFIVLYNIELLHSKVALFFIGTGGILVLHYLCFAILEKTYNIRNILSRIGNSAYSIYLLNTIVIGLVKGVLFMFISWDYENFFIVAPILILSGVIGPMVFESVILNRIPFIKNKILCN